MQVLRTGVFDLWLQKLRDSKARAIINTRLRRLQDNNPGYTRSVGSGVFEMKIDFGPGYRVYYLPHGAQLVVLLCGGDKNSQEQDVKDAIKLADIFRKEQK